MNKVFMFCSYGGCDLDDLFPGQGVLREGHPHYGIERNHLRLRTKLFTVFEDLVHPAPQGVVTNIMREQ